MLLLLLLRWRCQEVGFSAWWLELPPISKPRDSAEARGQELVILYLHGACAPPSAFSPSSSVARRRDICAGVGTRSHVDWRTALFGERISCTLLSFARVLIVETD